MTVLVTSYDKENNYHVCTDENGRTWRLDLFVDATMPDDLTCEDVVGLTIVMDRVQTFIGIASNPRIVTQGKAP